MTTPTGRLRRVLAVLACTVRGHRPGPLEPAVVTYQGHPDRPIRLATCRRCGGPVEWAQAVPRQRSGR